VTYMPGQPEALTALAALEALVDTQPLTAPQAQGDVFVLPWPASTTPSWRTQEVDAATPIPAAGITIDPAGSHTLLPEVADPAPSYHPTGKGYSLGTLVVPPGSAARLSHALAGVRHDDLLIGPGVYNLRQQRAYTGPSTGSRRTRTAPAPD
jgi:hypothetical protein